jgi:cbb3-type cytochrome oxidase maturation protein
MNIIYVLIPLGLLLVGLAVWAFFWATANGQFDDLDGPAWKILLDDDSKPPDAASERARDRQAVTRDGR